MCFGYEKISVLSIIKCTLYVNNFIQESALSATCSPNKIEVKNPDPGKAGTFFPYYEPCHHFH